MNCDFHTASLWATILSPVITIISVLIAAWALRYTVNHDSKVLKHSLRLDFSKRYQDLMGAMPQGEGFNERFALLYFDLCSEEYRLWQQHNGMVDDQTWLLWEEGMEGTLAKHPELCTLWRHHRDSYASTQHGEKESFQHFFNQLIAEKNFHATQSE